MAVVGLKENPHLYLNGHHIRSEPAVDVCGVDRPLANIEGKLVHLQAVLAERIGATWCTVANIIVWS